MRALITRFFNECLESNPGCDLRAMQDSVETEIVLLKVTTESPITDFSKDAPGPVKPEYALDFPHQVHTNSEASNLAPDGRVIGLVEIVTGAQPHIRIEPIIVF